MFIVAQKRSSKNKNGRLYVNGYNAHANDEEKRISTRWGGTSDFRFPVLFSPRWLQPPIFVNIIVVFVSSGSKLGLVFEWDDGYRRIGEPQNHKIIDGSNDQGKSPKWFTPVVLVVCIRNTI